jgi:hypothetical protein
MAFSAIAQQRSDPCLRAEQPAYWGLGSRVQAICNGWPTAQQGGPQDQSKLAVGMTRRRAQPWGIYKKWPLRRGPLKWTTSVGPLRHYYSFQ